VAGLFSSDFQSFLRKQEPSKYREIPAFAGMTELNNWSRPLVIAAPAAEIHSRAGAGFAEAK
jgi:hypothetical protein